MKLELRMLGVRQLNLLPAMANLIQDKAEMIANAADAAAGDPFGHRVESGRGTRRVRSAVITDTHKAMYMEARYRTLTSSIRAGRG